MLRGSKIITFFKFKGRFCYNNGVKNVHEGKLMLAKIACAFLPVWLPWQPKCFVIYTSSKTSSRSVLLRTNRVFKLIIRKKQGFVSYSANRVNKVKRLFFSFPSGEKKHFSSQARENGASCDWRVSLKWALIWFSKNTLICSWLETWIRTSIL